MYIADTFNQRIRKVTASTGVITTIAGIGSASYSGDNGQAAAATLCNPRGTATDSSGIALFVITRRGVDFPNPYIGNVYIADDCNHRIRKVTISTGIITTIAGTGSSTFSGDGGAATSAGLRWPYGVMLDSAGNVYIADTSNHRVRKVTVSTGIITTLAGIGVTSYSGDNGPATAAALWYPYGVWVDPSGNATEYSRCVGLLTLFLFLGDVYIGDQCNHRIRKVAASTGIITTIAGNGGTGSYSGDGGAATSAALNYPYAAALDASGSFIP